jgi:hypothetical protein
MKTSSLLPILSVLSLQASTKTMTRAFAAFPTAPKTSRVPIPTAQAEAMEGTVRRYFQGVHTKDAALIRSCFGETATIRDICSLGGSTEARTVPATELVARCMEFVAAHPDVQIDFYYGPECGRAATDVPWVVAHWYETGTWTGESCGLAPQHVPMAVEGQTRFRVDPATLTIVEFVVSRTFTDWEKALLEQRAAQE